MPAVAVIGGIATAAGAASGAAALIGGAVTLGNVAAGLAFVGGVTSALGGITGNKKLMKFGMISGVAGLAVGGISALANSAGEASKFALTPGAAGAEGVATSAADVGMQTISSGVDGTALRMSDMSLAPGADIGKSLSSIETGAGTLAEAPAQSAYTTGTSYALKDPAAVNAAQSNFAPGASSEMANAARQFQAPQGAGDTGSGAFGNFGQWMSQNKELVKTGSGMLSGLGQGYMEQEKMKEMERLRAQDRTRINASIMGQRARY